MDRIRRLRREHGAELALAAIVAVAAIIRFATLGDQSLDHDETVTAARVLHPSFLQSMQVVVNGERQQRDAHRGDGGDRGQGAPSPGA